MECDYLVAYGVHKCGIFTLRAKCDIQGLSYS